MKTFLCPADRAGHNTVFTETFNTTASPITAVGGAPTRVGNLGMTNYAVCKGSGAGTHYDARYPNDGLFWVGSRVKFVDAADGTSNTAMWAQCLIGTNTNAANADGGPNRNIANFGTGFTPSCGKPGVFPTGGCAGTAVQNPTLTANPASATYSGGNLLSGAPSYTGSRGNSWSRGQAFTVTFDTYLPPNSPAPDYTSHGVGWLAARGLFSGGALTAMADGAVRFVPNSVNPDVWRAAGSRNGGEIGNLD